MTLSAQDWVALSTVHPEIFERWPDYRVVLLAADDVPAGELATVAPSLLATAHSTARSASSEEDDSPIQRWQQAYREFGVAPRVGRSSVDALRRRAASERGVPAINPLVDVYNAISIQHGVPIGGEDLDRYRGPATLRLADGGETFPTTVNGDPVVEHPEPGEPVWLDGTDVTCRRWNWRQGTRTAITSETRRVAFIVDSLDAPDHTGADLAAAHLLALIPGLVRSERSRT